MIVLPRAPHEYSTRGTSYSYLGFNFFFLSCTDRWQRFILTPLAGCSVSRLFLCQSGDMSLCVCVFFSWSPLACNCLSHRPTPTRTGVFAGTHHSSHSYFFFFHRHAQNASFVAACPKNMHTVLRPRTKVRICHTHTLTHSLTHSHTLAPSLARTHSPSRSLTPTHSHIGVSHLLAAGAGPRPLPSVHAAVVESLGGGGFRRDGPPLPPHTKANLSLSPGGCLGLGGSSCHLHSCMWTETLEAQERSRASRSHRQHTISLICSTRCGPQHVLHHSFGGSCTRATPQGFTQKLI